MTMMILREHLKIPQSFWSRLWTYWNGFCDLKRHNTIRLLYQYYETFPRADSMLRLRWLFGTRRTHTSGSKAFCWFELSRGTRNGVSHNHRIPGFWREFAPRGGRERKEEEGQRGIYTHPLLNNILIVG
jgi:hypothetical protein